MALYIRSNHTSKSYTHTLLCETNVQIMNHGEPKMLMLVLYYAISCFSIIIFIHAVLRGVTSEQMVSIARLTPGALWLYNISNP